MQRNKVIIWSTFVLILFLSLATLLLPIPADWPTNNASFHPQLIINIIMALTHTCGAILFWTNLDVYTAQLRRSYIVLAVGTIITGIGTLQISLLTLLSAWNTPYAWSGATALPFLLSGLTMYLGIRSFARLVGTRHFFTKPWVILPSALLIAYGTSFIPHPPNPGTPESAYDIIVGICAWSGVLLLVAGWLAILVKRNSGEHYKRAMTWLSRALVFSAFVLIYQCVYTLISNGFDFTLNTISNVITVISGLLWIRAGYAFALTKYFDKDVSLLRFLFESNAVTTADKPQSLIDMVTYTAGLVSNSRDIDPFLDQVRTITAKIIPGQPLSQTDTESLISTYLKIEGYLLTQEVMRSYTQQEIRARLSPYLRELIAAHGKKAST